MMTNVDTLPEANPPYICSVTTTPFSVADPPRALVPGTIALHVGHNWQCAYHVGVFVVLSEHQACGRVSEGGVAGFHFRAEGREAGTVS